MISLHLRGQLWVRLLSGLLLGLLIQPPVQGQECRQVQTVNLSLVKNKSRVITADREVAQISVGSPEIANTPELAKPADIPADAAQVILLNPRQIFLIGKQYGTTNVILQDRKGCVFAVYDVEVTHDLQSLQTKLHQMLPDEQIKIYSSQDSLVLSGEVSNLTRMDAALKLAQSFTHDQRGGKKGDKDDENKRVVNLLQVGGVQQVMLEIKVAEVTRSILKRLGIQTTIFNPHSGWGIGAVKGGATFPPYSPATPLLTPNSGGDLPNPIVGPLIDLFNPVTPSISDSGLFVYSLTKHLLFSAVIDALKDNGLAKLLAEPTLTTLSGQEAKFRSGGEFPIPVNTGNNAIGVEFKEFGVGVNFLPVILDSGHINLKINVSVSDISTAQSANISVPGTNAAFVIPSLVMRSAVSTVELADGQSIAIAGLINDSTREAVQKFPGLGDVPILGLLFRSQQFQKDQSELVIFVTPRLAQPTSPQQVRLPTESFVEPSDVEFYLLGRMEGKPGDLNLFDLQTQGGGMEGEFGHGL